MSEIKEVTSENSDPSLLLVKGKKGENKIYIKSLAHAITTVVDRYGYALLKCVGASSVNNAMKSFTIASDEEEAKNGNRFCIKAVFENADFDGTIKTAMVLKVLNGCTKKVTEGS